MRLINTTTLQVVEFLSIDVPPYAILSHTWGNEEVTFRDMMLRLTEDLAVEASTRIEQKAGFIKIQKSCEIAKRDGFEYIWNDTCCIDKESSAELSEAINSMYRHYGGSGVCYAYLVDVSRDVFLREIQDNDSGDEMAVSASLWNSRWFTRGWTLQELLAPSNVVFYDKDWLEIGTRTSLADLISVITRIPTSVLTGDQDLKSYSIAQRMSWAAERRTTRAEDIAYCLMGIFGVGMPTLYGEGAIRAFIRLQEEIIKYNDDATIFAWRATPDARNQERGLLAWSPSEFVDSGKITTVQGWHAYLIPSSNHIMTNRGLRITLLLDRDLLIWHGRTGMVPTLCVALLLCVPVWVLSVFLFQVIWVIALVMMIVFVFIVTPEFSHLEINPALYFIGLTITALNSGNLTSSAHSSLWNTGLFLSLYLVWNLVEVYAKFRVSSQLNSANNFVRAQLPCQMADGRFLEIFLKKVPGLQFVRVKTDSLEGSGKTLLSGHRQKHSIYVKEEYLKGTFSTKRKSVIYRFRLSLEDLRIVDEYPIRGDQNSNPSSNPVILDAKRTTLKLTLSPDSETPREFALTFGRVEEVEETGDPSGSGNRVWLDVLTNISEQESLGDIYHSYDFLKHRSDLRTRALSRSVEPLTEDLCVSAVIRRAAERANDNTDNIIIETYEINVCAVPGNASHRVSALSIRAKYVFAVSLYFTNDVPLAVDVSPRESWVDRDGTEESPCTGFFLVKERETTPHLVTVFLKENKLFAVSLDIQSGIPRVDADVPPSAVLGFSSPRITSQGQRFNKVTLNLEFLQHNDRTRYYAEVRSWLYDRPHRFITHYAYIRIYKEERPRNDRTRRFFNRMRRFFVRTRRFFNRTRRFFNSWGRLTRRIMPKGATFNSWGRLTRRIMPKRATDDSADTVSERNGDIDLAELAV